MGNLAPVILAFILNLSGVYVFREVKQPGSEPLISSLIFLTSLFVLLLELRLYPGQLRKLWRCGMAFLNFTVSAFVMEVLMNDFWWPLEASCISILPKIADFEQQILTQSGLSVTGILQLLRNDTAAVLTSYLLSIFFLLSSLHATRIIDLRLLRCGPGVFMREILVKFQKMKKRFLMSVGLKKRRVCFNSKYHIPPDFADEFFEQLRAPSRRRRNDYPE